MLLEARKAKGMPRYRERVRNAYGASEGPQNRIGRARELRKRSASAWKLRSNGASAYALPSPPPRASPSANRIRYGSERERIGAREGEGERDGREDRKRSGAVPECNRSVLRRTRIKKAQHPDCSRCCALSSWCAYWRSRYWPSVRP